MIYGVKYLHIAPLIIAVLIWHFSDTDDICTLLLCFFFFQRSTEDWSVSSRASEENPDQCSVNEAQRWWPVSYWISVTTQKSDTVRNVWQVYSLNESAVVLTLLFYPHTLQFWLSETKTTSQVFLTMTLGLYVSAWPQQSPGPSFNHRTDFSDHLPSQINLNYMNLRGY